MPAERGKEMDIVSFRIPCGPFIGEGDVERYELEKPGKALVPNGIAYSEGIFAGRAIGNSMAPTICDKMWCIFHKHVVGSRQDRLVLVEDLTSSAMDRYTLKKYRSTKKYRPDGTWSHDEIDLLPLNPEHPVIHLTQDGTYRILGWFVGAVSKIQRVEDFPYRDVSED